jgi:tetratricopeptide (TPR) repeat protein
VAISLLLGVVTSTWQAIRANAALADLRASAPAFAAQARSLVVNERIDEAIEILDSAIKLRPDIVDYLVTKADLLESRCRFSEAAATYRRVLQLSPGHVRADAHAVLCQNLAAEMSARSKLSRESLMGLFSLMEKEDRSVAERMMIRQLLTGGVLMERWLGAAFGIDAFTADPRYPLSPTTREKLQNFESPANSGEYFGSRIRGFLTPPVSGSYTFWIASDDESILFLSNDDSPSNKRRIAYVLDDGGKDGAWTNYCQWTKYESQRSAEIELKAGKIYYVEALHSQGWNGDHMEVAWQIPGTSKPTIIAGQYLSPWPVDRALETQIVPNTYAPKGPSTDSPNVSPQ